MKKMMTIGAAALLGIAAMGMSGCADKEARAMAQQAQDTANAAQACCDANSERLERMYQKVMGK